MTNEFESRRKFLTQTAALAGAYWSSGGLRCFGQPSEFKLPAGKDSRLIVHSGVPNEWETPLALLRMEAVTPSSLLFVRNNQGFAAGESLAPAVARGWKLEIAGMVNRPATIDAGDLLDLEQVEQEMVLQCSGNGRAYFASASPVKGAPWTTGAMGNVRFAGVPLKAMLKKAGVEVLPVAQFLTAEGRDLPLKTGEADFEHSLPLTDIWERSMVALRLNGQPLPALHGGPLRLVTPGYYGTMHVKWLSRLRFTAAESDNYHQVGRYRTPRKELTPGEAFSSTLANSDANWNMRIKSVIFSLLEGERLPAGKHVVEGVAWNDGQAKIVAVELSLDGRSWHPTDLQPATGRYAWQRWRKELSLAAGETRILARAVDAWGRTQPLDGVVQWNPAGYAYSGVHAVKVNVV